MKRALVVCGVVFVAVWLWAQQSNFPANATTLLGFSWAAPGTIGSTTPSTGAFTSLTATSVPSAGPIGGTTPSTGAFTTLSASGQISSTLATGTAPLSVASTTPVATMVVTKHPLVQACGTTSTCSATATPATQVVFGSAPLVSGTPSTVSISGISPAFSSNTSYKCILNDQTTATNNLVAVTSYVSGSSFTITGPATNTDVIAYICVGN